MARDKSTRPCGDCGTKATSWEWCSTCEHWVGDECNETHDCVGAAIALASEEDDAPGETDGHAVDCDDRDCEGCGEEDDEDEQSDDIEDDDE